MPINPSGVESKSSLIMVVDDNAENRLIASTLLEDWGFKFKIAENGAEAVELFKKDEFSLILMDLQMPIMSGIDATKMIRHYEDATSRNPTPIIALTANNTDLYRSKCEALSMDDFIVKPYSADELLAKINIYAA